MTGPVLAVGRVRVEMAVVVVKQFVYTLYNIRFRFWDIWFGFLHFHQSFCVFIHVFIALSLCSFIYLVLSISFFLISLSFFLSIFLFLSLSLSLSLYLSFSLSQLLPSISRPHLINRQNFHLGQKEPHACQHNHDFISNTFCNKNSQACFPRRRTSKTILSS